MADPVANSFTDLLEELSSNLVLVDEDDKTSLQELCKLSAALLNLNDSPLLREAHQALCDAEKGLETLEKAENLFTTLQSGIQPDSKKLVLPEWVDEVTFREFLDIRSLGLEDLEGMTLSAGDDDSVFADIKRWLHTLKGEAGALGLYEMEQVCHKTEDVLANNLDRDQKIDLLLNVKDWFSDALLAYSEYSIPKTTAKQLLNSKMLLSELEPPEPQFIKQIDCSEENSSKEAEVEEPMMIVGGGLEANEESMILGGGAKEQFIEAKGNPKEENDEEDLCLVTGLDDETLGLINEFIEETEEGIGAADSILLNVEARGARNDDVNALFRVFHTIKGVSGFLGFKAVQTLSHNTENMLNKVREGIFSFDSAVLDLVFDATETMRSQIACIREAVETSKDTCFDPSYHTLVRKLEAANKGLFETSPLMEVSPEAKLGEILKADIDEALISQKKSSRPIGEELVAQGKIKGKDVGHALRAQRVAREKVNNQNQMRGTVKIDLARIDSLVEMIGELVIVESMVANAPEISELSSQSIRNYLSQLTKITRDLQGLGMQMRMVPLRSAFQKMARLVRDLSKKQSRNVKIILNGEATEMDRSMVELINDPLIHMIRNAVDHGIEPEEDRVKAGKSPGGRIELSAYHEGGSIVVEIKDDGKGLDKEAILEKALAKGLITPGLQLSDGEIFSLIFAPGFSTAKVVTEISGRGVGMDVVKKNIDSMRGRVLIESTKGQGTSFKIILPLTLAIIDGMLVACGEERYIIPTLSIIESIKPEPNMLVSFASQHELINFRGHALPLIRLDKLFQVPDAEQDPTKAIVIILEGYGRKLGLLVDEVLTQQQVVIKTLGYGIQNTRFVSGANILPDGRVGLILNVEDIGSLCTERGRHNQSLRSVS